MSSSKLAAAAGLVFGGIILYRKITKPKKKTHAKLGLSIVHAPELYPYSKKMSLKQTDSQIKLWNDIINHPEGQMSSSPDESQFLGWLCQIIYATRVIEVGVFMGSTTLALALSLPDHGTIVALDINEDYVSLGEKYWKEEKVRHKIDLRIGAATSSLQQMITKGDKGKYDLAFIDADKVNYDNYYEYTLQLIRKGGIIAIDNVFWKGRVLNMDDNTPDTVSIRTLNEKIKGDDRVHIVMLPIADGLTLCRKL